MLYPPQNAIDSWFRSPPSAWNSLWLRTDSPATRRSPSSMSVSSRSIFFSFAFCFFSCEHCWLSDGEGRENLLCLETCDGFDVFCCWSSVLCSCEITAGFDLSCCNNAGFRCSVASSRACCTCNARALETDRPFYLINVDITKRRIHLFRVKISNSLTCAWFCPDTVITTADSRAANAHNMYGATPILSREFALYLGGSMNSNWFFYLFFYTKNNSNV